MISTRFLCQRGQRINRLERYLHPLPVTGGGVELVELPKNQILEGEEEWHF